MRLASIDNGLDGELVVVNKDNSKAVKVSGIAPSLMSALENWKEVEPKLVDTYNKLNNGEFNETLNVSELNLSSPLKRSYLFADGSAFIQHIRLVRMARNAEMPETLETVPLMYQGECSKFLAPDEDIPFVDDSWGLDFEAEVGVITDHVPMGSSPEEALKKIRLFVLINDVSLRGLIPAELKQGFGFFQSKPASALSPIALTADELGDAYNDGRVKLPIHVEYNGEFFGKANAQEMHFHFGQLIAHAAKTRDLQPGSLIGSGTVANEDTSNGASCLAEKRMLEKINEGEFKTPFMKPGETIRIYMNDASGESLFGEINQKVRQV